MPNATVKPASRRHPEFFDAPLHHGISQEWAWSYGVASFISIARLRENKHWASDVTAGATLGYIVGSSVCRRTGISIRGAKLSIAPTVDLANRRVGVLLSLN